MNRLSNIAVFATFVVLVLAVATSTTAQTLRQRHRNDDNARQFQDSDRRSSGGACPRSCDCTNNGKSVRCHDASSLNELSLEGLDENVEELEIVLRNQENGPNSGGSANELPSGIGRRLNLKRLIVRNGGLTSIPRDVARGLQNVQTLDLAGNQIQSIAALSLQEMPKIETLQLSNNQISELTSNDGLNRLQQLQYLGLDNNQIRRIESRALADLPLLLQVTLRGNRELNHIADDAFRNSVRVEKLDLSGSGFTSIPPAIDELTSLQQLNLESNQLNGITNAELDRLLDLALLKEVNLDKNPIQCDNNNARTWIRQLRTQPSVHKMFCERSSIASDGNGATSGQCPQCESPAQFKGRAVDVVGNSASDAAADKISEVDKCPCPPVAEVKQAKPVHKRQKRRRQPRPVEEDESFAPSRIVAVEKKETPNCLGQLAGVQCSENACYMFSNNISATNSWSQARFACQAFGFDLVVVESDQEQKTILNLLKQVEERDPSRTSATRGWWIGVRRSGPAGPFLAVDTGEHVKYTNWAASQPNNFAGAEDCAEMWDAGEWNDLRCEANIDNFFICKQKI